MTGIYYISGTSMMLFRVRTQGMREERTNE